MCKLITDNYAVSIFDSSYIIICMYMQNEIASYVPYKFWCTQYALIECLGLTGPCTFMSMSQ